MGHDISHTHYCGNCKSNWQCLDEDCELLEETVECPECVNGVPDQLHEWE